MLKWGWRTSPPSPFTKHWTAVPETPSHRIFRTPGNLVLKCQHYVTSKILSCDSVVLALMPALSGSKSKETAGTHSPPSLARARPCLVQDPHSSTHLTALPRQLPVPWKSLLLPPQSSVPRSANNPDIFCLYLWEGRPCPWFRNLPSQGLLTLCPDSVSSSLLIKCAYFIIPVSQGLANCSGRSLSWDPRTHW